MAELLGSCVVIVVMTVTRTWLELKLDTWPISGDGMLLVSGYVLDTPSAVSVGDIETNSRLCVVFGGPEDIGVLMSSAVLLDFSAEVGNRLSVVEGKTPKVSGISLSGFRLAGFAD